MTEAVALRGLEEFQEISDVSDATHEYTVAWFDSFGGRNARGIFFRGNHAAIAARAKKRRALRLPLAPFAPLLNPLSVRAFNAAYYRASQHRQPHAQHYDPFFYPLDAIANWNVAYGRRGFVQYQCVIPIAAGVEPLAEILDRTARSRMASFLTVIKKFADVESPGILSFPRPGTTLCLDFAAKSAALLPMRETFDAIVAAAGPYALQRLQALRRVVETFRERPDLPAVLKGPMPAALKSLKGLTQMGGDSGAYRMLLFAGDHPVLPVNAAVERTARRLGYGAGGARDFRQSAQNVRDAVARELPATSAAHRTAYVYLAHHGVTICKQADPECPICPLKAECPGRKAIVAGVGGA